MAEYPQLLHTVLDSTRPRELAEFYRQLLGLEYRPGDEPPTDGTRDEADWLVLVDTDGVRKLAFQQVDQLPRTTWPKHEVPCSCTSTSRFRAVRSWRGSVSEQRRWARSSCSIGPTSPASRCTCSRICQDTRSASSSPSCPPCRPASPTRARGAQGRRQCGDRHLVQPAKSGNLSVLRGSGSPPRVVADSLDAVRPCFRRFSARPRPTCCRANGAGNGLHPFRRGVQDFGGSSDRQNTLRGQQLRAGFGRAAALAVAAGLAWPAGRA